MQLTTFTDYGLRTLLYLAAQPEKVCSVREISEHYGISRNHLVKVVHKLAQLSYIRTTKGKGGGILLACDPKKLRIGDLVEKLEPNMRLVECFDKATNTCKVISSCELKHYLIEANRAFIQTLNTHTLEDSIKSKALFMSQPR